MADEPAPKKRGRVENLKPFQPGNPGGPGRPSKMEQWRRKVEAEFDEWVEPYYRARAADDPQLAMKAADQVFDRLFGKATQRSEVSGQVDLRALMLGDSGESLGE